MWCVLALASSQHRPTPDKMIFIDDITITEQSAGPPVSSMRLHAVTQRSGVKPVAPPKPSRKKRAAYSAYLGVRSPDRLLPCFPPPAIEGQ